MGSSKKIFISHSEKDVEVVECLIDLLEGIGIKSTNIFCTSLEGYGVPLGADFLRTIKDELNGDTLVLFILTENFYNSSICMCEMGAAWIKANECVPILVPPLDFPDMRGVIPHTTHGIKINNASNINTLKSTLIKSLRIDELDTTIWERKRKKYLKEIEQIINDKEKQLSLDIENEETIALELQEYEEIDPYEEIDYISDMYYHPKPKTNDNYTVSYGNVPSQATLVGNGQFVLLSVRRGSVSSIFIEIAKNEILYDVNNLSMKLNKGGEYLQVRGIWFDDKNWGVSIYVDLIHDSSFNPSINEKYIKEKLHDGWNWYGNGQTTEVNVRIIPENTASDGFFVNSKEYYNRLDSVYFPNT
ncbi:toll/interleukin-1 receptor domain-containing protein [Priestia megaterium]|uniref:toll/interleukin-1 receptor domain-containing protein n=1 Tax=Priestia megaterium TaxID=1404 RepID=UPI00207A1BFB|nr:toll/interleukin-1 receptor domain-containing protein [Priestia megaterium]USL39607.1 toll/interleukin-1 receptor domain-containing protein [Priestia megaterium]